ncbi:MAG: hypothetical protein AAFN30_12720 [Actinomycetota bacterium]
MYVYATTLPSVNHQRALRAAARFADVAAAETGLGWVAYEHVFAAASEVVTVAVPAPTRTHVSDALAKLVASTTADEALGQLRSVTLGRQDSLWFVMNPPPDGPGPLPEVVSLWIAHATGPIDRVVAWAEDMTSFVDEELGQHYLFGIDRIGPPGRLAFLQYADDLAQDEERDLALYGHPETLRRLSQPVEDGLFSTDGDRIIMARITA